MAGQCCDFQACCGGACCYGASGDVTCGGVNQPCCPNPVGGEPVCTAPDPRCGSGTCRSCGQSNQQRCDGRPCANGCCVPTGGDNNSCIAVGQGCFFGQGGQCTRAGACGNCGGLGQACCSALGSRFCTAANTTCQGDNPGVCVACGGQGQPSCPPNDFCAAGRGCQNERCQ